MKTTLNQIRANSPCGIRPESDGTLTGWLKLKQYLGEDFGADAPIDIRTIIDSNGLDDALWCLSSVIGRDREHRLYAVWCTRQVQHLMTDQRSLDALDVAERFANGLATKEELAAHTLKKNQTEYEEKLKSAEATTKKWQQLHTQSTL